MKKDTIGSNIFITVLNVKELLHLKDIRLQLCDENSLHRKHLLITGKNGSGKTSLLNLIAWKLKEMSEKDDYLEILEPLGFNEGIKNTVYYKDEPLHGRKLIDYYGKAVYQYQTNIGTV